MKYVICWTEYLRDGQEPGSCIVNSVSQALDIISRIANDYGHNYTIQLFELGKEIELTEFEIELTKVVTVEKKRGFKPKD